MWLLKVIFLFSFISFNGIANSQILNGKLDVLVLYESLCPDSERFMAQQLGPHYDDLKDFINIRLVPFGKSVSRNNGAMFYCQHGPAECEGNRMQSCVLQQTMNQEQQVKFAVCQITLSSRLDVRQCAERAGLSGDIGSCMATEKGTLLQLQAEQITQSFRPTFVPTIIYDNVFDQQLQDSSLRNFRCTVCSLLQKRGIISLQHAGCQCMV